MINMFCRAQTISNEVTLFNLEFYFYAKVIRE